MASQIRINYIARIGGGIALLGISLGLGWGYGEILAWGIGLGFVIAVLGALTGGTDYWKCDFCHEKFENKGDCINHEKKHKRSR